MRFNRRDILRAVAGLPFVGSLFAINTSASSDSETDSGELDDSTTEYGSVDSFETDSKTDDSDDGGDGTDDTAEAGDGYGEGEYGDGPYGDPDDSEDDEDDPDDPDDGEDDEDDPDDGDDGEDDEDDPDDGDDGDDGDDPDDGDDEDDDSEDDGEEDSDPEPDPEPTADPVITRLDASDTSNPRNPHADIRVDWAAEISEGELKSADLVVDGAFTRSYDVSGQTASGGETERVHHGGGRTYPVELVVRSGHDTETVETTEVESP